MITIKIRAPGSPVTKIRVKEGVIVREVINELFSIENQFLYTSINGKQKSLDTVLINNDLLTVFPSTLNRVDVKCKGNIWRIHLYDKDNFPSDFHAHNIDTGEKLDL